MNRAGARRPGTRRAVSIGGPSATPVSDRDCLAARASELAYHIADRPDGGVGFQAHCPDVYADVLAHGYACFLGGHEKIDAAFVSIPEPGLAVVSFRGTLFPGDGPLWGWVDDWLEDFDADPVPWHVGGEPYGRVEHGFDRAVRELWTGTSERAAGPVVGSGPLGGEVGLRDTLARVVPEHGVTSVLVTGHSKGAAATYLAASLVRHAHPDVEVRVVCFAAPFVGDAAFRRHYRAAGLLGASLRYQNVDDLVPYLPNWWVATPLTVARWLARVLRGERARSVGGWTTEYVSLGELRVIDRASRVRTGVGARLLAAFRIVTDLLTLQIGRIASAHSLVTSEAHAAHPTGRYTRAVCGSSEPNPCSSQSLPKAATATA